MPRPTHSPLKMRDAIMSQGFELLRSKGLIDEEEIDYSEMYENAGISW
jgi:hypothetical protein